MLNKVFRAICTICGMLVGYGVSSLLFREDTLGRFWGLEETQSLAITLCIVVFFGLLFFNLFDTFRSAGKKISKQAENSLLSIPPAELIGRAIGFILGLITAYLLASILSTFLDGKPGTIGQILSLVSIVVSISFYFLFATIGGKLGGRMAKGLMKEGLAYFGINIAQPAKTKSAVRPAVPKILDTSAIIDGRVYDVLKSGFLEGAIIIPEFVLVELRHIADSADSLKRQRGRRGLDVLNKIQEEYGVEIYDTDMTKSLEDIPEVDVKLLKLAQKLKGVVVTNDYNLNKVAGIQGIGVLNINELSNILRPVVVPGEEMTVLLVKEGKEANQALAYLEDGTMIVIEGGKKLIGQNVPVVVSSVLQSSAGRMIFARPK